MHKSTLRRLLFLLAVALLFTSLILTTKLSARASFFTRRADAYSLEHLNNDRHPYHDERRSEYKYDALNQTLQERSTTSYDEAVKKGRGLISLMESTIARAKTLKLAGNTQSPWMSFDSLGTQGWVYMNMGTFKYKDLTIDLPAYGSKLNAFFSSMGISFNQKSAQYMMSLDEGAYLVDEDDCDIKECLPSEGIFGNMIDTSSGTIVADLNRSPLSMNYNKVTLSLFCPIRQWSDAVYTQWVAAGAKDTTSLNYIVRAGITNPATEELVIQALQKKGTVTKIPTWNVEKQLTLTRADDGDFFAAVIGSPNGAGGAYLLAQHKAELGIKQLESVRIWMSGNEPFTLDSSIKSLEGNLNLLFTVETVADPIDWSSTATRRSLVW